MMAVFYSLNCMLCTSLPDSFANSSILNNKRKLNESSSSTEPKQIYLNYASDRSIQNILQLISHPENEINSSTCRLCRVQRNYLNGTTNLFEKMHNFSLIQLTPYLCDERELSEYLCQPAHFYCVLFKIILFVRCHADIITKYNSSFADDVLLAVPTFVVELKWLALVLRRASIKPDTLNELLGPIVKVDGQPIYSTAELNDNWLKRKICSALPKFASIYIQNYCGTLESINSSGQIITHFVELPDLSFDYNSYTRIMKNSLLFFSRLGESIKMINEIKTSYLKSKKNLYQNSKQVKENEAQQKMIISQVSSILEIIDYELKKMYNMDPDRSFKSNPFKVISTIYVLHQLPYDILSKLKPRVCAKSASRNFKLDDERLSSFREMIYNLSTRAEMWRRDIVSNDISAKIRTVQGLIDFIADFQYKNEVLDELSLKKIQLEISDIGSEIPATEFPISKLETQISKLKKQIGRRRNIVIFWISKVVLSLPFNSIPKLCYILLKMDVMKDSSIFMIFRYSFIIRHLLYRSNNRNPLSWFEVRDSIPSQYSIKIEPRRLVRREIFMKRWEEDQSDGPTLKIKNLTNIGIKNETESEILDKVYNLFDNIYTDMNNILDSISTTIKTFMSEWLANDVNEKLPSMQTDSGNMHASH